MNNKSEIYKCITDRTIYKVECCDCRKRDSVGSLEEKEEFSNFLDKAGWKVVNGHLYCKKCSKKILGLINEALSL
jgi:hypothetical protein